MIEDSGSVSLEKRGASGWIHLSRPERMNALTSGSIRMIWTHLSAAETDPGIRALVFTGRGDAFCAGMDMAGLENANPLAARRRSREVQILTNRIADSSLPTIAAVNGVAMGAGLEICLACDLVVASAGARFGFAEVRLGMIPCGGGTQRLSRYVGLRRAREMVFTGKVLGAEAALEWGLVNDVVEAEDLVTAVERLVERLAMGGRMALYQAKRCINNSLDMDLGRGMDLETECLTTCFASGEPMAAMRRYAGQAAGAAEEAPWEGGSTPETDRGAGSPDSEPAQGTAGPASEDHGERRGGEEPEQGPEEYDDIFE